MQVWLISVTNTAEVFKMGGHDGQSIPKLVSHLLHLLGHATESRFLATSSLCIDIRALMSMVYACTTGSTSGLY